MNSIKFGIAFPLYLFSQCDEPPGKICWKGQALNYGINGLSLVVFVSGAAMARHSGQQEWVLR